jgi:uncharacterized membrane protein SpoIIM required for sporulation
MITLFLGVALLAVGVFIAWTYIDTMMSFDDKEDKKEVKETLPIENYEVEKPIVEKLKSKKHPSRRKPQNKQKSN